MSWTEIFPIFDEDMVERYQAEASAQEKAVVAEFFEVEEIYRKGAEVAKRRGGFLGEVDRGTHDRDGHATAKHIVATSLFWKPASVGGPAFPAPSEDVMRNPGKHGLSSRFKNPWEHYVEPVFEAVRHLGEIRPDLVYRVYLAKDLEFLIPELVGSGCEVYLMKSSSILHNPGAMWRFLAMEEEGLVTMSDSDRAREMIHDIERTELVAEGGLCYWRCPYFWGTSECKDLGLQWKRMRNS